MGNSAGSELLKINAKLLGQDDKCLRVQAVSCTHRPHCPHPHLIAALPRCPQAGVPTNTHIFNSLITACLVGGALQNALAIFEWMVSGRRVTDDIQADTSTYNILIKACHQVRMLNIRKEWKGTTWFLTSNGEVYFITGE